MIKYSSFLLLFLLFQAVFAYNIGRGSQIDLTEQEKHELSNAIVDYEFLSELDSNVTSDSESPVLSEDKSMFKSFLYKMKYYWNYLKRQVNKKKDSKYLSRMAEIKHQVVERSPSELTLENRIISGEALQYALIARNMKYKEDLSGVIGPKNNPLLCDTYRIIYEFKSRKYKTAFALYESEREYVMAFKGTSSKKELFLIDFDIGRIQSGLWSQTGSAHRGFVRAFEHMLPELTESMKLVNPDKRFVVTGHSLGGALATLFTEYLAKRSLPVVVNALYTFGAPRVGDAEYVKYFDELVLGNTKVVSISLTDGVAKDYVTLPLVPGFKHIGGRSLLLPCENKAGKLCKLVELHYLRSYIISLSNAAPWKCTAR